MGTERVVLLLLLAAVTVLATSEPEIPLPSIEDELARRRDLECIGDQTGRWKKDCNWCSCKNGRPACTRKLCPQGREDTGPQCEGNAAWRRNCDTCRCENGNVACTLRACAVGQVDNERKGSQVPSVQNKECEEGSRWRVGCNWCHCEAGQTHCTQDSCEGWNEAKAREDGTVECHGTSRWKNECNWCSCFNGRARCTKRACLPSERDPFHSLPSHAVCVPGSRWMKECNWCSCGETGRAACTLRGCLPGYRNDGPTCEEGSVWRSDDCNICRCIDGNAACTKKQCHTPPPVPKELECQGDIGDRWRMDCNWCSCHDGIGRCTRRLCPEGVVDSEPACEGSPSWMRDCNRCSCANGTAVCTTKFCGPLPPQVGPSRAAPHPEPKCTGEADDTWTDECNRCQCRNGVPACTRRLCRPGQDSTPVCTGNPSWKQDCNDCHCNNGNVVCTEKFCGPLPPQVGPSRAAPHPEPRCTGEAEDDSWTKECNRCQCKNGVPACTRRLCRPGEDSTPVCTGNPSWKQDCNVCRCNNGTVICTKRFCGTPTGFKSRKVEAHTLKEEQKSVCVDGSRWRDGCNWCTCTNGMAMCTLKACLDISMESDEPECLGDATWKQDCNWCTCGVGMAVCTRMACFTQNTVCIEGSTWFDGCNVCRCSNGFTLCTKKACITPENKLECKGESCGPVELPALCRLPPVEGQLQCTAFFLKWTFSVSDNACQQVVYGGCGGTENLFDSEEECKTTCPTTTTATTKAKGKSNPVTGVIPEPFDDASKKGSGDRCHLPKESGPCFGYMKRYAFNPTSGLCEEFIFGGCGGNRNNFGTEEQCLAACEGSKVCDKSKCPWSLWGHYLAKECVPQYAGDACCPTSFQCPSASEGVKDTSQSCYYKGVSYNLQDSVPVTAPCSASCTCVPSFLPGAPAEIRCADVECPELFRPPQPGCRPLFKPQQCCAYDHECENPLHPMEPRADASCTWQNKTYYIGSKMFFDDYPCQQCVCSPDFTDPTGPGCYKIDCGLDFRYNDQYHRGCTPILFEEDGCCPIGWMCPEDSRIDPKQDQEHQQPETIDESSVCHLGGRRFAVGEILGLTDCKIVCRCMTPPELTCIQYRSCEVAQKTASERVCPSVECEPGCRPVIENLGDCPTCSCSNEVFSCPALTCPSNCDRDVNADTGCPTCNCKCDREMVCPTGCPFHTVYDETTGCPKCECKPGTQRIAPDACPTYPNGRVPCPMDCAIIKTVDENGCEVCKCDPDNTGNPFGPPPLRPIQHCPRAGEAPCPMDCAIIRSMDENGCEVCRCNPDNPGNPFMILGPPPPFNPAQPCPGEMEAPCPMNCAIQGTIMRYTDENGCEVCKCDPDHPGS